MNYKTIIVKNTNPFLKSRIFKEIIQISSIKQNNLAYFNSPIQTRSSAWNFADRISFEQNHSRQICVNIWSYSQDSKMGDGIDEQSHIQILQNALDINIFKKFMFQNLTQRFCRFSCCFMVFNIITVHCIFSQHLMFSLDYSECRIMRWPNTN